MEQIPQREKVRCCVVFHTPRLWNEVSAICRLFWPHGALRSSLEVGKSGRGCIPLQPRSPWYHDTQQPGSMAGLRAVWRRPTAAVQPAGEAPGEATIPNQAPTDIATGSPEPGGDVTGRPQL